jgi:adenine phosphoribosyltransferase
MSRIEDIKDLIRNIPDFPKKGIMFKDITSLLNDERGISLIHNELLHAINYSLNFNKIVAIESRGFIIASMLTSIFIRPLVLARKPGKLPNETLTKKYSLEYGEDALSIQTRDIKEGDRVLLIDDVVASGNTAKTTCQIIEALGGRVEACYFLVELTELGGRKILEDMGMKVISSIKY